MNAGTKLINLYLSNVEMIDEGLPAFIAAQRGAALEELNLSGLPAKGAGGDRYHYTDIASRFEGEREQYFTPSYTDIVLPEGNEGEYTINLLNGFFAGYERLVRFDSGIVFGSLAEAARDIETPVSGYYNKLAGGTKDTTADLNTIFAQDGSYVYIPSGAELDKPLRVRIYGYSEDAEAVAVYPRLLIVAEEGARAQVVVEHVTLSGSRFTECCLTETFVAAGAAVDMAEIFDVNAGSVVVANNFARQDDSSVLDSIYLALGGEMVRANINVSLKGRAAENHTNGLSVSGAGEHFDFSTNIEHIAPECTSYEHFKAIAADGGTGIFSGRIYVAPDAQQTQAYQKNNNLLLSDNAHIYTKPQLEIYADNVKCSHGATVGQLDREAVYYMRQRGISERDARRLQMYGFVNEIIGLCHIGGVCERIERAATGKIEGL